MYRQRGQPTKEVGTQGKTVSPMRWGSWVFVSHRWTQLGSGGARVLVPWLLNLPQAGAKKFPRPQSKPSDTWCKHWPLASLRHEDGKVWSMDGALTAPCTLPAPKQLQSYHQSSPLLVFNISLLSFSLSFIYSPAEHIFYLRVIYSSAIKYTILACLFLPFHRLYVLHKLRC